MSLLLHLRQTALGCSLALAFPAAALAQAGFSTNGVEFAVAGSLPGDQARPHLALNSAGGLLVWQDNATCPFGLGISALALDSNFSPVGTHFRVNKTGAGDQENPRVTLLHNGAAAFVWQTRNWRGSYNVFARFLSTNNTWLTSDVRVNTRTNFAKSPHPSVVTLANGQALVVWASFNQVAGNSMQDVFGQRFSPSGQRLGSEFLVNQFTFLNQRSPAVAPLANGGFVVAWVSEQQRVAVPDGVESATVSVTPTGAPAPLRPSVDIYARIYDAGGAPAGNEFLVNTGADVCANPSVAPAPDGGFIIAWSQKDLQVRTNGWDIHARSFSSSGAPGTVRRVNTWAFGDQFNPQLSSVGTTCLAVWTSLAQDGSFQGVFGQFLQTDGSPAGGEFRVNTTIIGSQRDPAIASDNQARFLPVWTSYSITNHSFDLFGQVYASAGFVPSPVTNLFASPPLEAFTDPAPVSPSPGGAFVPHPGAPTAGPGLDFPSSIESPALPDALDALPGAYSGLFFDTNGVSALTAGFFTAKVSSRYSCSGKLMFAGRSYSFSGKFDSTGSTTVSVRRGAGLSNLALELQLVHLDSGADQIRGFVKDRLGNVQAEVMADRLVFSKANPAPYAGSYTMVVVPSSNGPEGSGFATLKVSSSGLLRCGVTLADGSKFTQGATLSAQGDWPAYASLYRGQGLLTGWLRLATGDQGGRVIWIKPRGASAPCFQGSFTNSTSAVVSPWSKTADLAEFQSSNLSFTGASLGGPVTKALALDSRGRVSAPSARELSFTINPSSGLFRGNAVLLSQPPGKLSFQGVLLENGNFGSGFFQNRGLSGQVYWSPGP